MIAFFLSAIIAALAVVVTVVSVYLGLRRFEVANTPIDTLVNPDVMAALTEAENLKDTQQNHLAGISIMQAGLLRGMPLRIAFWVIGQMATRRFRPGFLGGISTIHYARWLRLPKTNKLLFSRTTVAVGKAIWRISSPRRQAASPPYGVIRLVFHAPKTCSSRERQMATVSGAGRAASSSRHGSGTAPIHT
ncbi:hypothetical protein ACOJBM_42080 [Rhizobium beringeri]